MKKSICSFIAGSLTTILIGAFITPSLAAVLTSRATIEVDPINIQVNGDVFVPHDATGAEVPVFAYQGTTYAPLRALAEAYGLKVGYDAESNMATVGITATSAPSKDDPHEIKSLRADQIDHISVYLNGERITSETEPVAIMIDCRTFLNFELISRLTNGVEFSEDLFANTNDTTYYTINGTHYIDSIKPFGLRSQYSVQDNAIYLTSYD